MPEQVRLVEDHTDLATKLCGRFATRAAWARRPEALSHCYAGLIDLACSYDGRGTFKGYVNRFLEKRALDHVRKEQRQLSGITIFVERLPIVSSPEHGYNNADVLETLRSELGDRNAGIVVDVILSRIPMRIVAERVGITEAGISLCVKRSLEKMRRRWPD